MMGLLVYLKEADMLDNLLQSQCLGNHSNILANVCDNKKYLFLKINDLG